MTGEENIKLKILDLEKRFVELEMTVSKLNESLKALEAQKVNEILERFEELEDLVIVENAAVSELKELIEGSDSEKFVMEIQNLKKEVEERINNINSSLLSSIEEIKKKLEENSTKNEDIKILNQKITELEEKLKISPEISETKNTLEDLLKLVKLHDEYIEKIKQEIGEVKETKTKMEEELNKRIPSSMLEDFVKMSNELSLLKVNISSLSKQLDETYRDVKLLKPDLIREVLSKVTEIKVEMEDRVKEINELVASISSQREEIRKLSVLEAKINELSKLLNSSNAELESLKSSLSLFSTRKEFEKIEEIIEGLKNEIAEIKDSFVSINEYNQLKISHNSLSEENTKIKESLNKLSLELELLRNSIDSLSKNFLVLKNKTENLEEISPKNFVRIEDFSALVFDVKKNLQDLEKIKQDLLLAVNRNEFLEVKKEVENLKREIEEVRKSLLPPNSLQQMLNKLSFLEAKIKELEKTSEVKVKPIILE